MDTPISVSTFVTKSHDSPDERRTPPKTQVDLVRLEGFTLGRFTFQPGWRWSECIKPVVGTESCQLSHVGYAVAGRITIHLPDGRGDDPSGRVLHDPAWSRRLGRGRGAVCCPGGDERRAVRYALTLGRRVA
jgi:hypothetical protein